jgi:catechol-2,3-dioxygenase
MTNPNNIQPKFHHVNLTTTRLQEMIEWYGFVIGLKPTFQFPGGAWLTNDEANHRLALLAMPGLTDDPHKRAHTGIHHHAYEFETLADLLTTYSRLKARGVLPAVTLDHGMTLSFYYPDPDGNLLELQVDNFGDWAASTEWMSTSAQFAANPIGVQFDPDKLVEALAAGLSHAEIHRKAFAGEYVPANPVELGV